MLISRPKSIVLVSLVFGVLLSACQSLDSLESSSTANGNSKNSDQVDGQLASAEIRGLKSELERLKLEDQRLREQIEQLKNELVLANQRATDLEAELRSLQSVAAVEERAKLNAQLAAAEQARNNARNKVTRLEGELADAAKERAEMSEYIDRVLAQESYVTTGEVAAMPPPVLIPPSPEAADSPSVLDGDIETIEVFYGTNRARLSFDLKAALSTFLLPLILTGLWLLVPGTVRTFIKNHLQLGTRRVLQGVLALVIVISTLLGAQKLSLSWQNNQRLAVQYGPDRMPQTEDKLAYELGTVTVSIPPDHQQGEVELPNLLHFEFLADPTEHFVIQQITPVVESEFFDQLRARVAQSTDKDMFVFVHGFHNTFQDAAFRTAQIAHDIGFKGAPVFFSWPSQGAVQAYTVDENNVKAAVDDLRQFLLSLKRNSQAEKIHLIAHSMGNRALTDALRVIVLSSDANPQFNEVILAAPDVDAEALEKMTPDLTKVAERVTLYASSRDKALTLSRKVHGGAHPRAGESYPTPLTVSPMESIDVSGVSGSHSYIADNGKVLVDLRDLLMTSRSIQNSGAVRKPIAGGEYYWEFE